MQQDGAGTDALIATSMCELAIMVSDSQIWQLKDRSLEPSGNIIMQSSVSES